jgi:hypothetical protein
LIPKEEVAAGPRLVSQLNKEQFEISEENVGRLFGRAPGNNG